MKTMLRNKGIFSPKNVFYLLFYQTYQTILVLRRKKNSFSFFSPPSILTYIDEKGDTVLSLCHIIRDISDVVDAL